MTTVVVFCATPEPRTEERAISHARLALEERGWQVIGEPLVDRGDHPDADWPGDGRAGIVVTFEAVPPS